MTRELIMNALNRCEPYVIPECCVGCPYDGCWGKKEECITQLHADTYALLKAQGPVGPVTSEVQYGDHLQHCSSCGKALPNSGEYGKSNYCYKCGRPVKWDD